MESGPKRLMSPKVPKDGGNEEPKDGGKGGEGDVKANPSKRVRRKKKKAAKEATKPLEDFRCLLECFKGAGMSCGSGCRSSSVSLWGCASWMSGRRGAGP